MNKMISAKWAMLVKSSALPIWVEDHVRTSVQKILRARNPIYFAHLCRTFEAKRLWAQTFEMLEFREYGERFSYADWRDAVSRIDRMIETIVKVTAEVDAARSAELVERVQLLFALQTYVEVYVACTKVHVLRSSCLVFDPWPRLAVVANEHTDAYSYVSFSDDAYALARSLEEREAVNDFAINWSWRICGFSTNYRYSQPNDTYVIKGVQYIFLNDPRARLTYLLPHEFGACGYANLSSAARDFRSKGWRIGASTRGVTLRFAVLNGHTYWGYCCYPGPSAYTAITGCGTTDVLLGYSTATSNYRHRVDASGMIFSLDDMNRISKQAFPHGQRLMQEFYPWQQAHGGVSTLRLLQKAERDPETDLFWHAPVGDYYRFVGSDFTETTNYCQLRPFLTYLKYRTDIDGRDPETYLTFAFLPPEASDRIYCAHGCFHERTVTELFARTSARSSPAAPPSTTPPPATPHP